MRFYLPTDIIQDEDCISKHGDIFKRFGQKCLIVTGQHSSQANGSLQDVLSSLKKNGIQSAVFSQIEENPSVETVMKATQFGLREKVDFVVGIGGGSPLDAAKAVALMIRHPEKDEKVLYEPVMQKRLPVELDALPVVAVPTTAGTGSEVTPYAILTRHDEKTKKSIAHKIFPQVALVDAKYLSFAGRDLLVNTAIDALAHLIESDLNTNATPYSRMLSEEGLRIWIQAKEALLTNHFEKSDYDRLMRASTIAGMAIAQTGTSLPHGLSYALTYSFGVPHGKAVGIFLPGFLDCYNRHDKAGVDKVLTLLDLSNIEAFRELIETLLGKVTVALDFLEEDARSLLSNQDKLKNYPFTVTEEEFRTLIFPKG